jgi:hypothetical protein
MKILRYKRADLLSFGGMLLLLGGTIALNVFGL